METQIAIVTGGSRGIGRAVVDRLVSDGASVVACGRGDRPPGLDDRVRWVRGNVANPADAAAIVDEAVEVFGPVTLLVNNAGIQIEKTIVDTTDDEWELLVGVNCRGTFNMARAVIPLMADGGVIINIGSISGVVADPAMALYNASKAFVHGLTRSIAVDHGPQVRCNAILPGWIATDMAEAGFALAQDPEAARHDAVARHPAARLGTPDDVANAVTWLASPSAKFITGQTLTVDGGLTAASPLRTDLL